MLDIKLVRTNPDLVRENIKKKFQEQKLPLVDEVLALDKEFREAHTRADYLRSQRNSISKSIGALIGQGRKDEAEAAKQQVKRHGGRNGAPLPSARKSSQPRSKSACW